MKEMGAGMNIKYGGKGVENNNENRKHHRLDTRIAVKYRKIRDGALKNGTASISKDLSKGGVRFRAAEFVSMACRLILEMELPVMDKTVKVYKKNNLKGAIRKRN